MRPSRHAPLGPAILGLLAAVSVLPAQEAEDPLHSISEAELRDHIHYLASDFLQGRDAGENGYRLAAQYGATHFRAAGLEPMLTDTAGAATFFQEIRFESSAIGGETVMRVTVDGAERTYRLGEDFLAQQVFASGAARSIEGVPVFLGHGIEEPELGWDDYAGVDVSGKIGLVVNGAPTRDGQPVLPQDKHETYSSLQQSGNVLFQSALAHDVSTLIVVPDSGMLAMWDRAAASMSRPSIKPASPDPGQEAGVGPLSWIVMLKPEAAAYMLSGTGIDPISRTGSYATGPLENVRITLELQLDVEAAYNSPNVVGLLPGTDPVLKDEYIVVTAHLDHVGVRDGVVYNGADDNASGSAAVLEAAEAAAMEAPRRSIIFALFTAEEKGLHGSRYFADHPPVPLERIALNVNLDMVGRNSPPFPESLLALASENRRPQLLELITGANDARVGARLDMRLNEEDPQSHILRSDQYAFIQKGIPAILITRGFMGPDYHQASDDPETINYEKVRQAAALAFALATEAANREVLFESR